MDRRGGLRYLADGALGVLIVALPAVSLLCEMDLPWRPKPLLPILALCALGIAWTRELGKDTPCLLKSPLGALALAAFGLGVFQLVPLPSTVMKALAPKTREVQSLGFSPQLARSDDPSFVPGADSAARVPITWDRSATLRRLGSAWACLALFVAVSRYADRLRHTVIALCAVIAPFFILTAPAIVEVLSDSPKRNSAQNESRVASIVDIGRYPTRYVLERKTDAVGSNGPGYWVPAVEPRKPFAGIPDGPGQYLALGSIALPAALGLLLHLVAAKGGRLRLWERLDDTRMTSRAAMLFFLALAGALIVGLFAPTWLLAPFCIGALLVCIPPSRAAGSPALAGGLTVLFAIAIGAGAAIRWSVATTPDSLFELAAEEPVASAQAWKSAAGIISAHPFAGVGIGAIATAIPYYKTTPISSTHAQSTILGWVAETGVAGIVLLVCACAWSVAAVRPAIKRVGAADRHLAFAIAGAGLCALAFATVHWSFESTPPALAFAALAGLWHRWSSGASDLFADLI